jgi:glycine cleavage system aminomethyltransferase T
MVESLEDRLAGFSSPVAMLRRNPHGAYAFPMRPSYSNWRDEQAGWARTAVMFDQAHHMTDVNFRGPDVLRLLSSVGVNSFHNFGKNMAKQFIGCNEDGHVIGDAILFGLDDGEVSLVGPPTVSRWVEYQARTGGYDVEVRRDEMSLVNTTGRRFFRHQLQGPNAMEIAAAAAAGTLPEIKTFRIGGFEIAGRPVRALNHSMTRKVGLEIWGSREDGPAVRDALLAAGEGLGLLEAGALAYSTTALESGWLGGVHVPAIYSGESMRAYREWMRADVVESVASLGGSFVSDRIEDYYVTPWAMGFGRLIKFDHDFIGRSALERMADEPHRTKVWLRWNNDDVTRAMASSLFDDAEHRAKFLTAPYSTYSTYPADAVHIGDELVGISTRSGYTANVGSWSSLAMLDERHAVDGTEVVVTWGEPDGGAEKPSVEQHAQTEIRAVVSVASLA